MCSRLHWRGETGRIGHSWIALKEFMYAGRDPGERAKCRDARGRVRRMFGGIGIVMDVEDEQIDAATAVAGSGQASVYAMIEVLARGGENMGLDKWASLQLAAQTTRGASELMITSGKSPAEL